MCAITLPAWMIAATAAGAPAGAAARPSAPIVRRRRRGRRDLPGRLIRLVRRAGRVVSRPSCVDCCSDTAPAMPPERAAFLSVRTSRCVSTPSTRSPAARSNRRTLLRVAGPNAPSVAAGIAELRQRRSAARARPCPAPPPAGGGCRASVGRPGRRTARGAGRAGTAGSRAPSGRGRRRRAACAPWWPYAARTARRPSPGSPGGRACAAACALPGRSRRGAARAARVRARRSPWIGRAEGTRTATANTATRRNSSAFGERCVRMVGSRHGFR